MSEWSTESRWLCDECGDVCKDAAVLRAPNPFNPEMRVAGCPSCREVNSLRGACSHRGCNEPSGSGRPTRIGYLWACHRHSSDADALQEKVTHVTTEGAGDG